MKHLYIILAIILFGTSAERVFGQETRTFKLSSPDNNLTIIIETGEIMKWRLQSGRRFLIKPSAIGLVLKDGDTIGSGNVVKSKKRSFKKWIKAFNYKKDSVKDYYNELELQLLNHDKIIFRAYDDGMAYRFASGRNDSIIVQNEIAEFNFDSDLNSFIPYVNNEFEKGEFDMYQVSFENTYNYLPFSEIVKDTAIFAPVLVDLNDRKLGITEADLESYPGMFLQRSDEGYGFRADFARYPVEEIQGGHNNLQSFVTSRADFIASTKGTRNFPWRVIIVSNQDRDLLNNDMVYRLAAPSRIKDSSWIQPGKVAWDWWNDWNISGVDFPAGINTATYKYYIDFASDHNVENILLDEGWAESNDIMKVVPDINLEEIVKYARQKNVGVWLWGGWLPLDRKTDEAFSTYSKLGIKGFKVDFMDRDDQKMVDFYYRIARKAAQYQLMIDFHGSYKPTGLQRTYPNVLNFEGVQGLEHVKWSNPDFPQYDCSIPFIRMLAGPLDYTPGAMRNAIKKNFRDVRSKPMSQGTRVHQLALYVIYEAPFAMLADSPTQYLKEPESVQFISRIPTVFDETVALAGQVGQYAAIARRKDAIWYLGSITNWNKRELELDLSFLDSERKYEAVIFKDGVNAERDATDYIREIIKVDASQVPKLKMAQGGGFAAIIYPI